jgi:hypothetical protein
MAVLSPIALDVGNSGGAPLQKVLNEIRTWLDSERVEPVRFKIVVGRSGLGFEISFRTGREAERFEERFASLLNAEPLPPCSKIAGGGADDVRRCR